MSAEGDLSDASAAAQGVHLQERLKGHKLVGLGDRLFFEAAKNVIMVSQYCAFALVEQS